MNAKKRFNISGIHCSGCEEVIREAVLGLSGVKQLQVSYVKGTLNVEYDQAILNEDRIAQCLMAKGYQIDESASPIAGFSRLLIFLLLLALVGGVALWGKSLMPSMMQQITPHMDQLTLLGIGILTGFHCIGMCGGFVVAYTDSEHSKVRQLLAHLSYGFGKTLSYSVLGAGFGLLGAAIAFTPVLRGSLALAASVFLLIYGLKMLNVFAWLRRFTLRMPAGVNRSLVDEMRKPRRSPLRTGLLSGLLLGCGPLQAMYVMAAGSGDPLQGALILLFFGLGTLLPLLGFGLFASLLPPMAMRQMVRVSAILVMAMGLMMAQRGLMMLKGGQAPAMANPSMMQGH